MASGSPASQRSYWYWPHRFEGVPPIIGAARSYGLEPVVHALASMGGQPLHCPEGITMVRDLPDPKPVRDSRHARVVRSAQRLIRRHEVARRGSFDVAYWQLLNLPIDLLALLVWPRAVPLVVVVHDAYPHSTRLPAPLVRWLWARAYKHRQISALVVLHEHVADLLANDFGVGDKVVVAPPVIRKIPGVGTKSPEEPKVFLMFGRYRANKGVEVFLEAVRSRPERAEVGYLLAGRMPAAVAAEARQLAERRSDFDFDAGPHSDEARDALMQSAYAVVLPYTHFASQSAVLLDAYANGTPAVVTRVGALGGTISGDQSGVVVEPGSSNSLAAGMDELLKPARYSACCEAIAALRSDHGVHAATAPLLERMSALAKGKYE